MRSPSMTRASSQKTHTRKSARISELLALVRMELTPEDKDDDMSTVDTVKKVPVNGHSIASTAPQKNDVVFPAVTPMVNGYCAPIKHNSEDEPQVVAEVAARPPKRGCKRRREDSPEMVIKEEPIDLGYDAADPTGYGRPAEEAPKGTMTSGDFVPRRGPKRQARADYSDSVAEKPKEHLFTCALRFSKRCVNTSTDKSQFEPLNGVETPCRFCLIEIRSGSHKAEFALWRDTWRANSSKVPNARWFVQDCLLPFYLRCTKCHHFRPVDRPGVKNMINATDVTSFVCGSMGNKDTCNEPHSEMVTQAFEGPWMQPSTSFPYLLNSPAGVFLKEHYFVDYMGMSPAQSTNDTKCEKLFRDWSHPFCVYEQDVVALSIGGESMECDESIAFPMFRRAKRYYVACRNLILALWHINPRKYLTYAECEDQMICRGLSRVWYTKVLRMAYDFANAHGFINLGVIKLPAAPETVLIKPLRVVIVGAGISGISAARHLRSFGVEVVVVEAKSRIGGRLHDEHKFGTAVGRGGQIVTGLVNSPIILVCHQMGFSYREIGGETCPMLDAKTGELADAEDDALTSLTYNTILDGVTKWRESTKTDSSLGECIHFQKDALDDGETPKESTERLFHWHLANVEYGCGAPLSKISARSWDQNEAVGQFAGKHCVLTGGAQQIVEALAKDTDVRLNSEVAEITSTEEGVSVTLKNGEVLDADKVLVTVPLAILQKERIKFTPPLPAAKKKAINDIGAGLIEKVVVSFPNKFWKNVSVDLFAKVDVAEKSGLFHTFYDLTPQVDNPEKCVLMTYVCGDYLEKIKDMSDKQIIGLLMQSLKELFPKEDVPEPIDFMVTRWSQDPHIGMSYSYVPVGANGEDYDKIASSIFDKIYFAGEATMRFYPQTMNGSFVSGVREACKMVDDLLMPVHLDFVIRRQ